MNYYEWLTFDIYIYLYIYIHIFIFVIYKYLIIYIHRICILSILYTYINVTWYHQPGHASAALASAVKPRVCWARPPHVQWRRFSAVAQSIPGLKGPHGSSVWYFLTQKLGTTSRKAVAFMSPKITLKGSARSSLHTYAILSVHLVDASWCPSNSGHMFIQFLPRRYPPPPVAWKQHR